MIVVRRIKRNINRTALYNFVHYSCVQSRVSFLSVFKCLFCRIGLVVNRLTSELTEKPTISKNDLRYPVKSLSISRLSNRLLISAPSLGVYYFFAIDSDCPSVCLSVCHKHCFFFFVSRWNRSIFWPSVFHDKNYKTVFFDF